MEPPTALFAASQLHSTLLKMLRDSYAAVNPIGDLQ